MYNNVFIYKHVYIDTHIHMYNMCIFIYTWYMYNNVVIYKHVYMYILNVYIFIYKHTLLYNIPCIYNMYIVVYIRALNNLQICVVNALHCTYIQYIVNPGEEALHCMYRINNTGWKLHDYSRLLHNPPYNCVHTSTCSTQFAYIHTVQGFLPIGRERIFPLGCFLYR